MRKRWCVCSNAWRRYLAGDEAKRGIDPEAIAKVLRGMAGEPKGKAAKRLTDAGLCGRSKAYYILADDPRVINDDQDRVWWNEDAE